MPNPSELESLLAGVLADPASDAPRLVFADWLEEFGDETDRLRSEFVRVQVELAALGGPTHVGRGRALRAREAELLDSLVAPGPDYPRPPGARVGARYAWAGSVARLLHDPDRKGWEFRRGFVAEVRLPLAAWLGHGRALAGAHPLEAVRLSDREPRGHGNGCRWYWSGGHVGDDPAALPAVLWDALKATMAKWPDGPSCFHHIPREAAHAALSTACLLWARRG